SLLFVTLVWGATFVMVKDAIREVPPLYFLGIRFTLAAVALMLIPNTLKGLTKHWPLVVMPGIALALGYALQTFGLLHTSASRAGFITGLAVVLVPLFESVLRRQWSGRYVSFGVLLATLGLFLMSGTSDNRFNIGDLLVLGCAISFAVQIILVGRTADKVPPLSFAVGMVGVAALSFWPLALVFEPRPVTFSGQTIFAILLTALLATSLAFYLQCKMQQFTSTSHTALIFSAEPVFAGLFGYLLAGEILGPLGIVGGGMIVLGIVVAEWRTEPTASREAGEPGHD
ncbi:MAG: DMT family transporter, partial [Bacillota bacterium]|nr:DMT family transporter [Bacillota bacterium]